MTATIRNFILAGIGGAVAYVTVDTLITSLITGTTAAANMFTSIIPLVIAAGVVWLIISVAFRD